MTEQPLSQRAKDAAATLDAIYEKYPQYGRQWTAALLRTEAGHMEDEEGEAAEREAWTEELARDISATVFASQTFEMTDEWLRESYLRQARKLIDAGWHK